MHVYMHLGEKVDMLSELEFKKIYAEYAPTILKMTHQWLGDLQAAEDVTHDVFLAFLEHPERYDPKKAALRTYLMAMARYKAIDYMRRKSREMTRDFWRTRSDVAKEIADRFEEKVERELLKDALWQELTQALENLRTLERDVIIGHYVQGESHRLLAERLNRPLGTVKTSLLQGLTRLRRHFLKARWQGDELDG
ncbi:MAG: RNA polymerase sigma-70 factor [Candidatus Carbobacillus altaicus]|uniref:RNA polymerase sigma-70 factor n=1 Tax=Candidatus Carbonibacillus altaicus TaxID=2163959 RepID=A0A2R6Y3K8_9BACL|nr:MAG: RNA polymerase sigma-70 factor [Candidatus Carbobacillus altaicus]